MNILVGKGRIRNSVINRLSSLTADDIVRELVLPLLGDRGESALEKLMTMTQESSQTLREFEDSIVCQQYLLRMTLSPYISEKEIKELSGVEWIRRKLIHSILPSIRSRFFSRVSALSVKVYTMPLEEIRRLLFEIEEETGGGYLMSIAPPALVKKKPPSKPWTLNKSNAEIRRQQEQWMGLTREKKKEISSFRMSIPREVRRRMLAERRGTGATDEILKGCEALNICSRCLAYGCSPRLHKDSN